MSGNEELVEEQLVAKKTKVPVWFTFLWYLPVFILGFALLFNRGSSTAGAIILVGLFVAHYLGDISQHLAIIANSLQKLSAKEP